MRPEDPELSRLLNRFVPVRIVNFKGVDIRRFRFDYDLTFAALMMDAEGHTYSRFGTQDGHGGAARMSIPGLKQAMSEVLALHAARKPAAAGAAAAEKPFTVADFPGFVNTRAGKEECYHCHYANNARIEGLRAEGKFTKEMLFRYPLPENIGVTLDVDRNNVVRAVLAGSPADRAGMRAGDIIIRAEETPVLTSADLQWALDPLPDPGRARLEVRRGPSVLPPLTLQLPKGWRRTDIGWRPSQEIVPPTLGFWAVALGDTQKRQMGIAPDRMALRVNFFFKGPHWNPTRGDLRMEDIVVGINGKELPAMNIRQFHAHFRLAFNVGDRATLNVLRGGRPVEVQVLCLDHPKE